MLIEAERLAVYVNPDTGKSQEIPPSQRQFQQRFAKRDTSPLVVVLPPPPEGNKCFLYELKVTTSDTDQLYHVNQAYWIKFCMDCAAEAFSNGFFIHFKADPFNSFVREVKLLYKAEALAGDTLNILCWESMDQKDTIFFLVKKGQKECISCSIQFYGLSVISHL